MASELDVIDMLVQEIGNICDVLETINNVTNKLQIKINLMNSNIKLLNDRVNRIDPDYQLIKSVMNPESKEPGDTLTYYTTRCTSCGKVSPVGDYCIWCGEKDTCLEGGDDDEKTTGD